MKKITSLILALVLTFSLVALSACGDKTTDDKNAAASDDKVITVGASATPHAEILEQIKQALADEGYELKIVTYDDYVLPNQALADGTLDANYFQHKPYLDSFNAKNGTNLVSVGTIHYEPFGIYPGKSDDLANIADGATIAVPNDTTNEARALQLLAAQGLITVRDGAGLTATVNDITDNPHNLQIKEIEAAQLKAEVPAFETGDTVRVYGKIKEGNRERVQVFEGVVLKKQGGSNRATFTVRKSSNGVGVEKTWPLHSPNVEKVEVVRKGKVRRAKLNYLRDRVGKSAKVKEVVK